MKTGYMFIFYTKPVLKKKVQIIIIQLFRAKNGLAARCLMIITDNRGKIFSVRDVMSRTDFFY